MSIERTAKTRIMKVEVHAREWRGKPLVFSAVPDRKGNSTHVAEIKLDDWERPKTWRPNPIIVPDSAQKKAEGEEKVSDPPIRNLVNRFFKLTLSQKTEIVGRLKVAETEDNGLPDVERFKRALVRLSAADRWKELDAVISEMEKRDGGTGV